MERDRGLLELSNFAHSQQEETSEDTRWREILDFAKNTPEYKLLINQFDSLSEKDETAILSEQKTRGKSSVIIAIRYGLKDRDISILGSKQKRTAAPFASKGIGLEFNEDGYRGVRFSKALEWGEVPQKGDTDDQLKRALKQANYVADLRFGRGPEATERSPKKSVTFRWHIPSFAR